MTSRETLSSFIKYELPSASGEVTRALDAENNYIELNFNFYSLALDKSNNIATLSTILEDDESASISLDELKQHLS